MTCQILLHSSNKETLLYQAVKAGSRGLAEVRTVSGLHHSTKSEDTISEVPHFLYKNWPVLSGLGF